MYSDVVLGVPREKLEEFISEKKAEKGVKLDTELTGEDWKELVAQVQRLRETGNGQGFPRRP